MAALSLWSLQWALPTTYPATTAWKTRLSRWRFHRSLSSLEKAVMVSCPPRWTSKKGGQKNMRWWLGLLALTARWPSTKMATESANK
ncbi:hypothetical protein HU200_015923 [Digitaria exilis]|uniref:Secreted protein n=1 Tax=Digitaria exilis TaxID=1010633 RepID=A0A835F9U3_9POAL|nr:hypothetical protein HU200_015923 [Digitaria exilis]